MNVSANTLRHSWLISGFVVVATFAANDTFAIESATAHRFEVQGTATLVVDPPQQRNATLRLRASLSSDTVAMNTQALQSGARFGLTATLATASLVCYSDTIFRDDFDGDGF
ncbi:MAG: hypothetical protein WBV39_10705 [Rudaea sp.]